MTSGEASQPPKLSAIQRLNLIRTLNGLPGSQFGELAFSLSPPPGIIPPDIAAQGNRTSILLQWAEGTGGPGLAVVQELLSEILGEPNPVASNLSNAGPLFLAPRRNPFFTGREEVLGQIHQAMAAGEPAALSGLGGVGKTQTAAEYAHRYRGQYSAVLWVRAETQDELVSGLTALAQDLGLALSQEADQAVVVQLVKGWLSKNAGWLLVLDNADHLELVRDWLALCDQGHILLTTRASETRPLAVCVAVLKMPPQEGALFLLRRSGRVGKEGTWQEATEADQTLALALCAQMDGLPLALDQAGAYILETPSSLKEYLRLYKTAGPQLLAQRGDNALDHPSVTITFGLAVQVASQRLPAVAVLLNLCAFLAPDGIPEEVFKDNAAAFEEPLQSALAEPLEYMALLREAGRFSLVVRDGEEQTFSVHRLVQEVIRDGLDEAAQEAIVRQLLEAMSRVFPEVEFANWLVCDRLLPHALALVSWQQRFAIETESTGRLFNKIAIYLSERGRYSGAEPLYQDALAMRKRLLGDEHPAVATSLNNLAMLYDNQGRYGEAEPLYQDALAMRKRLLGDEHPAVATSLNNLALLYDNQGRYREAEPLYQDALAMRKRLLGDEHPDIALSLNNLAMVYYNQRCYGKAEPLFRDALAMKKRLLGDEHPAIALSLNNLAMFYENQGRYGEAEPLFQNALAMRKRLLGDEHPAIALSLNNLAALCYNQGRYGEAEPLFQDALAMRKRLLGDEHPAVATSLNNLAMLYDKQGRYSEAELLYQDALAMCKRLLGDEHPDTKTVQQNLEILRQRQGA
ncbi:tetratricopeptide repeat protein [Nodosilinea sp. AN01ver1]|uniref:tetratricopeptide repeat protein n=1 Tax=Nodosilinea sp. AN01ver1 TaxID=3423362 RepID=UPI003D315D4A